MKMNFLRRLALLCAVLTCGMLLALPAAAAEADAPYAEDGDMDYIRSYVVTVDPREDGSVDITYDIDWQVIDGDKTDYLSWVKIGLANSSVDELTPLTDTISDLQYTSDGGSYAKVVFRHRYYAPDVAAANGGESSVHFAFSVHQSHLFTKNDDGTANFAFTPGWFDDLSVENMQVRWHNYDGFVADNTGVDGDYLTWDFGAMGHGQQAMVHVTVPVTNAAAFDPGAAMTTDDYDSGMTTDEIIGVLATVIVILLAIAVIIIAIASQSPEWGGGFGGGQPQRSGPRRGENLRVRLNITFEEAAFGCEKEINVGRVEQCPDCKGNGCAPGTTPEVCPDCKGTGSVRTTQRTPFGMVQTSGACKKCGGRGKIIHQPCPRCGGRGAVRKNQTIKVKIPAGIDDGQTLNLRGKGNAGLDGGPAGDLLITVFVKPHPLFERDGNSVLMEMPVTFAQAALGAEIEVPTIDGRVKLTIPEGTQPGSVFRLRGKGIPYLQSKGGGRGDQFVTITVTVPKNMTSEQKERLRAYAEAMNESVSEGRSGIFGSKKKR